MKVKGSQEIYKHPIRMNRLGDLSLQLMLEVYSSEPCNLPCAKCPLCLKYGPEIMMRCKHYFHKKCWEEWNQTFSECPCCK